MNPVVAQLFSVFLYLLMAALVLRAILSWFPIDRRHPMVQALSTVTEPILDPIRRVMPRLGMIDLAPIAAIILIALMLQVVEQLAE